MSTGSAPAGWSGTPAPAPTSAPAPQPSFLQKVFHWFHDAGVWVGHAFVTLFGKDAATQFATGAVALLKTELGQIAITAVTEAAKLESNTEKFSAAGAAILAAAEKAGLAVTDSMKNLLIELAVQRLKLNFGPADQPPVN